ncbi:hypothetical protein [Streptomyces sp. HB2AG]|uniref:hypothetical protein n=1 Tax=Streptomyces sp. HB2AG TaxID=2983400 RepID=UPI0022AA7A0B|nr:hypothetical protein [Streptomyces sp. HB2AG]MCZ2523582.1 hypothetical protein [Streptomyces sp. HB2AG]
MKRTGSAEAPTAHPALEFAGGCLSGVLVLLAGLLIALSFGSTVEIESPEQFAGLRDNDSGVALAVLVLGVVALLGGLAVAVRTSRVLLAVVGAVCGVLIVAAGYRGYTLSPMLKCWEHDTIARNANGSYTCYDR